MLYGNLDEWLSSGSRSFAEILSEPLHGKQSSSGGMGHRPCSRCQQWPQCESKPSASSVTVVKSLANRLCIVIKSKQIWSWQHFPLSDSRWSLEILPYPPRIIRTSKSFWDPYRLHGQTTYLTLMLGHLLTTGLVGIDFPAEIISEFSWLYHSLVNPMASNIQTELFFSKRKVIDYA